MFCPAESLGRRIGNLSREDRVSSARDNVGGLCVRERICGRADARADCLYAPGVSAPDEIAQLVKAVAPKPVNVLVSTNNCKLTVSQLADVGVRRISVGGALARAAWTGFIRSAREIYELGSFT